MPVHCDVEITPMVQEQFHELDKVLMRHAFDMHNALGRFFDERIYQEELANRCGDHGIEAHREVEIRVSHDGFSKNYYLDLLVERGTIYELKTSACMTSTHQSQLINYLLLTGTNHGKLVNFRSGSVESRFVSTHLKREDRSNFKIDDGGWRPNGHACMKLPGILECLLQDWGAFLDANLYREALAHFLREQDPPEEPVDIEMNGRVIGTQKLCLLNPETAWHLSAARVHLPSYETHIRRLLRHTRLQRIHWINFNHRTIALKTLQK